jgi:hypothetical protein
MRQQFNVGFCTFSYGGNGGISSEVPDIREWMIPLVADLAKDPRVEQIRIFNLADTPITMTRNRAVLLARQYECDVLVMIDSDMKPDINAGQPGAKPFFSTSFDFLVDHYPVGPVAIGAPYCGPPPHECVYVFRWQNRESESASPDFQLEMYDRHSAVQMAGIQECAALPTGLIMYDMRCFDLTEPKDESDKPWFYYEWKDKYAADKASTEDVTQTRDLSIVGHHKLGYNPVYCNWDAWAGHWKPKCVGKPVLLDAKGVGQKLRSAWESGFDHEVKTVILNQKPGVAFDSMGMDMILDDQAALANLVYGFIARFGRSPSICEVGSWAGRSALIMATAGASVHCVDTWEGSSNDNGTKQYQGAEPPLEVFKRNTRHLGKITHTVARSPEAAALFQDGSFDIVYIDAEHDFDSVLADIRAWRPKAKHWLAGHDYQSFPQVAEAVKTAGLTPKVWSNVWLAEVDDDQNVS